MNDIIEKVSNIPLFKGLPQDQLKELSQIVISKRFSKGEPIFSEGEEGKGFYVVIEGLVKVFKLSLEGKEQILHIMRPYDTIAEVAVFAGNQFPANAEALQNSLLYLFPRASFICLIHKNPSLALNMLAILSMRLRQFTLQVESLSLKEVPGRLSSYILSLSSKNGSNRVALTISKGQLASLLGTVPETLSRVLTKMKDKGWIKLENRTVTILDRESLQSLIDGKRF